MPYPVLLREMAEKKVSIENIAHVLGTDEAAAQRKLDGNHSYLTLEEALNIKNVFFPKKPLEELFLYIKEAYADDEI